MSNQQIIHSCCIAAMKQLPSCSIGAIIVDPPYEINFMGGKNKWDNTGIAYNHEVWEEALRVTKPGGFVFSFGGTRTYHRVACAIEDAGWKIRDTIAYVYASGFPKSSKLDKGIAKAGGNVEEWKHHKTAQLKPAFEPIIIAQKPLIDEGEPNSIDYKAPFFYCSKASTKERTICGKVKNKHSCLKPIKLLGYLMDLVTPPEAYKKDFVVLDFFMGSGSGALAAAMKDLNYIGIEKEQEYCEVALKRLEEFKARGCKL